MPLINARDAAVSSARAVGASASALDASKVKAMWENFKATPKVGEI
jgi:hypothetical protein